MAYQMRMLFRLAAPAGLVLVGGLALAMMVSMLSDFPVRLGGSPLWPGIGDMVAVGTGIVALIVYVARMWRYWRWTQDMGDVCFVCLCLLGRIRDGRYGPYRKCLGCGKNHAL